MKSTGEFRLLFRFFKGYGLTYALAIISTAVSALLSLATPLLVKITIDNVIGDNPVGIAFLDDLFRALGGRDFLANNLWIMGVAIVSLTVLNGFAMYARGKLASKASESVAKRFKDELYNVILKANYGFYSKYPSGDIIQRCTSDVEMVRSFLFSELVEVGRTISLVVLILSIMVSLSVKMALISSVTLPVLVILAFWFFRVVEKNFKEADEAEAEMTNVVQENITGMRVVKAFSREEYEIEKFVKENSKYRALDYKLYVIFGKYWAITDFLSLLQIALVVIFGVVFAIRGDITIGTLVVFTSYESMLLWPVRQFGRILSNLGKMKISLSRISEVLSVSTEEIVDDEIDDMPINGEIEFKNVSFGYSRNHLVLDDVSFKIEKGQTVAFFGTTGSGKSTIINLLMRLYEPISGEILIDGRPISQIPKTVIRRNIGLVPQEAFLFSKKVRENIALTKPYVHDEEIINASKMAHVHGDIIQLEEGYDTLVGEKGVTLSGGQRQRVTIARTLLNNYRVLVFDDSMSAVDTETEAKIVEAIKARSKSLTTIIVSHRIASIRDADKIIVLEKGKVTNVGTHNELISKHGLYQNVWKIQSILEREKVKEGNL
ncbi:MAG TPA: ABC transporter ATP-binding protein [Fervidobacterium sp.]|nr:ABC transporter ATP-binding protein [Fervidobacterium sp.]HPT53461.1 ABC transporter ATP-binding protein [Fervidobacterium sp.]